jgi:hypothetical protein
LPVIGVSSEDRKELRSVVEYLVEVHGYQTLQPYFIQDLDSLMKKDSILGDRNSSLQVNKVFELMNLADRENSSVKEEDRKFFSFRSESTNSVSLEGYDFLIYDYTSFNDTEDTICVPYQAGKRTVIICFDGKKSQVRISDRSNPDLLVDISDLIKSLREKKYTNYSTINMEDMTLISGNDKLSVKIIFKNIIGVGNADSSTLKTIEANILFKAPKEKENEVGERNQ